MKYLLFFIFLTGINELEACVSGTPPCPGMETTKICRKSCGPGSYEYKYGSNCMDGWQTVNGICRLNNMGSVVYQDGQGESTAIPTTTTTSNTPAICETVPSCPSGNYRNICRRPCPGGGFYFQFFASAFSGCLDHTEPDPGQCSGSAYATSGGRAHMTPGARRPGETNHQIQFPVEWKCRQVPALTASIPEARTFNFTYGRPPWGHGSTGVKSGFFNSPEWDSFLSSLPVDEVDIRQCLSFMRTMIQYSFKTECKLVEVAAGLSKEAAKDFCDKSALETFILPKQALIASKEIEIKKLAKARPLYVIGHPTSNGNPADDRYEANKIISNCKIFPNASDYSSTTNTSLKVVEEIGEILRSGTPVVTDDCRKSILKSYVDQLANMQLAKCNKDEFKSGTACTQIRTGIAGTLSKLGQAFPTEMNQFAGNLATRACVLPSIDLSRELRELELNVMNIGQCLPLPVGQSRIINAEDNSSPTLVKQKYRLSRTAAKEFQVDINMSFTPADKDVEMKKHVQKCMDKTNGKLLGPDSQKLTLKLTNDSAVPSNGIEVMPEGHRSNSLQWETGIDCETVTHEMMHLLGLVDEYQEKWLGNVYHPDTGQISRYEDGPGEKGSKYETVFNCRVHGPDNSLMSHQGDAFTAVNGKFLGLFKTRNTLLYPAQFNAIAFPGCMSKNKTYYLCSRYAYETSNAHYGGGCSSGKPTACQDGKTWLEGN